VQVAGLDAFGLVSLAHERVYWDVGWVATVKRSDTACSAQTIAPVYRSNQMP
jgi:hypothetical protein